MCRILTHIWLCHSNGCSQYWRLKQENHCCCSANNITLPYSHLHVMRFNTPGSLTLICMVASITFYVCLCVLLSQVTCAIGWCNWGHTMHFIYSWGSMSIVMMFVIAFHQLNGISIAPSKWREWDHIQVNLSSIQYKNLTPIGFAAALFLNAFDLTNWKFVTLNSPITVGDNLELHVVILFY